MPRLGAYCRFSGIVTFTARREVREAAALCPLDRMLVETDARTWRRCPTAASPTGRRWCPSSEPVGRRARRRSRTTAAIGTSGHGASCRVCVRRCGFLAFPSSTAAGTASPALRTGSDPEARRRDRRRCSSQRATRRRRCCRLAGHPRRRRGSPRPVAAVGRPAPRRRASTAPPRRSTRSAPRAPQTSTAPARRRRRRPARSRRSSAPLTADVVATAHAPSFRRRRRRRGHRATARRCGEADHRRERRPTTARSTAGPTLRADRPAAGHRRATRPPRRERRPTTAPTNSRSAQ